jgi:hypothetical protein
MYGCCWIKEGAFQIFLGCAMLPGLWSMSAATAGCRRGGGGGGGVKEERRRRRPEQQRQPALFAAATAASTRAPPAPVGGPSVLTTAHPPPRFPFTGCDELVVVVPRAKIALRAPLAPIGRVLESMRSELIWLGPAYPTQCRSSWHSKNFRSTSNLLCPTAQ